MTASKRIFDLVVAVVLGVLLLPVIALVALTLVLLEGFPVFYSSERMRDTVTGFRLVKFRTMRPASSADSGVSGGDKTDRISGFGRFLRRSRLDELPQLWNVLTGDMSFVGPRPPLRQYVDAFPELYVEVLKSRPGITGLASLCFHGVEERLLAACKTPEETDAVYRRRCVPRKAALDLIYQKNRNLCFDFSLMVATLRRITCRR